VEKIRYKGERKMKKIVISCLLVFSLVGAVAVAPRMAHADPMEINYEERPTAGGNMHKRLRCSISCCDIMAGAAFIGGGIWILGRIIANAAPNMIANGLGR